jgi:ribosomal protein S24E
MEITIVEEKENPFLNRKDIKLRLKHLGESTPSKETLTKELASRYSVEESQILIDYIFSVKGVGESFVKAKILPEKPHEKPKGERIEAQTSEAV